MTLDMTEIIPARGDRPALTFQLGDHVALDFLNTTANLNGRQVEWLESGADLLALLTAKRAIDEATATRLAARSQQPALAAALEEILALREWFRGVLPKMKDEGEIRLSAPQMDRLNAALARLPSVSRIEGAAGGPVLVTENLVASPQDLIGIVAGWIADLLCGGDLSLIKPCESDACTLWFYDRTKSHRRRWCSPSLCGNREKVAAHRARKKRGVSE